jgi:para-nitrobenzyl esterase
MNNAARAPITAGSPDAQVLADQMSGAWASFARSSVPSQAALPPWAPYELSERSTMIFNRQSLVLNDPSGEERGIWDGIL